MATLKDEEVLYMLEIQLPEMLEKRPDLEPRAFRAFIKAFTTKEETAAILAEMREFRAEFHHFRSDVETRFDQIDRQFDQIDRQFEQVDQRFEQVDQRFDQVDQRFVGVDQRFEQMDQRFDQVDQRFVGVDQRFEQMDQRLANISDQMAWINLTVGRFQTRVGHKLEDMVAGALRFALKRPDIRPDSLRLRQKLVDVQGIVGPPGRRRFEIDILAENGQLTVFEVKSLCGEEDVGNLADKVVFVQAINPDVKVVGAMLALGIEGDVEALCAQYGIILANQGY